MANKVSTSSEGRSVAKDKGGYRFNTVTMDILINDMRFNKGTPAAGDSLPEFNLTSTSGERITWQNFGGRPVLMPLIWPPTNWVRHYTFVTVIRLHLMMKKDHFP